MRISRSWNSLLILVCATTGCSQTGGVRPNSGSSSSRTVASVGDKPLAVATGDPGSSSRGATESSAVTAPTGARISGRVYDENGKPVPNAKVRLAVGSSPGGKINYAITDQSGAFTLRGLRADSSYTVIAEYSGGDGVMSGRVDTEAPSTNVRISLQPRDMSLGQNRSAIRAAKPRVEPISNLDTGDDQEVDGASNSRSNERDLEPPDEEAAAIPRRSNVRTARASSDASSSHVRAGWNVRQAATPKADPAASDPRSTDDGDGESPSRSSGSDERTPELDDDGPNPLPPAIEADSATTAQLGDGADEHPVRVARGSSRTGRRTVSDPAEPVDRKMSGQADWPPEQAPLPIPEEILPPRTRGGGTVSYEPTIVIDGSGKDDVPSRSSSAPRRGSPNSPARVRSSEPAGDDESTDAGDRSDANGSAAPRPRPTWRELSTTRGEVPLDESISRPSAATTPKNQGVITLTGVTEPPKPRLARLLAGGRPPLDAAVSQTVCQIDPAEGRVVDFQLPGLDGKMVSLHDIDADLILLDFWGSWCKQCNDSIPHLGELQAKLGGKRLQVVGIACEKGATVEERIASAAKGVQEFGIKYPVLVTTKDGSCPVQKGLQVKFYPTMLLLDRNGRLLEREQGATETTLARIDQAVESELRNRADRSGDGG